MAEILFLCPSELLAARVKQLVLERGMTVDVQVAVLEQAEKIVENAIKDGLKVVISRGGSTYLLRRKFNIPTIAAELTSGCYIKAFERIRDSKNPVAFFTVQDIPDNVRTLCYLLNVDARYYHFDNDESARTAVQSALKDGCTYGVGGVVTEIYSREAGIDYVTLENSPEDIEIALNSAQQLLNSINRGERHHRELQLQLQRYEAVFDYTHDGIIAIDKDGKVEIVNKLAERILPLKNKPYEGKPIEKILPSTKLLPVLRNGEKEIDELMKVGNVIVNTNRVPIIIDGQVEGVVATFRDIESIRISEQKIRTNLHRKGLISRYRFSDMIGESHVLKRIIQMAKSYAKTNSSILITGEIGVGKEMFAHAIHHESSRKKGPFVVVNCANYSTKAMQEELLGYIEGASPYGGTGSKPGAFELAHDGTIFLDKIDSAPLDIQGLLMRIIDTKEVRRIGAEQTTPIDVRIIASVRGNILEEINQGSIVEELMYMISVLTLKVPPLRERDNDWHLMCEDMFHQSFGSNYYQYESKIKQIEDYLTGYEWKGNIRELKNVVERVTVLLAHNLMVEDIIPELPHAEDDENTPLTELKMNKWTRSSIVNALTVSKLNISRTARLLNCSRSTLYKKMKEFNIHVNTIK